MAARFFGAGDAHLGALAHHRSLSGALPIGQGGRRRVEHGVARAHEARGAAGHLDRTSPVEIAVGGLRGRRKGMLPYVAAGETALEVAPDVARGRFEAVEAQVWLARRGRRRGWGGGDRTGRPGCERRRWRRRERLPRVLLAAT